MRLPATNKSLCVTVWPLFITHRRHWPLLQKPTLSPYPPTKRSELTQSPPSLLSDRILPLTTKSIDVPPPPSTSSLAPGVCVPMPTLPLFSTVSRQSPLFQKPICPVPYPPTN